MVAAGRHRLLQLPHGADKQFDTDRVPIPRYQSLAAHATAAEPERLDDLGADQAVGRRLAPETANPSSVASESLRRYTRGGRSYGAGGGGRGNFIVHTNRCRLPRGPSQ